MTRNLRQRDPDEREALTRLRAGDAEDYLGHLARNGRLRVDEDPLAAKERLVTDWWQHARDDLPGAVMLAHRREDVGDLNAAARSRMLAAGRLGTEALEFDGLDFRVGARVICRRNEAGIGVRNGTRASIVGIERMLGTITVQADRGGGPSASRPLRRGLPRPRLRPHRPRRPGREREARLCLVRGEGALAEWVYVACSRARDETRLYGARDELDGRGRETETRLIPPSLCLAFARSALEALAMHGLER